MYVDIRALKEKMRHKNMTQQEVARMISVDKSTFSRKMKNCGASFTIGEMHKIADILALTNEEAIKIFLAKDSQKCNN